MSNLSFKDFMKSKNQVESLQAVLGPDYEDVPGYIYDNTYVIELNDGIAHLHVGNSFYNSTDDGGIKGLEKILHKWYSNYA